MVAFVLRELGHDPAWIVGGVVPQLAGNAGAGEGWLVVEGDESDRSIGLLEPEIAVVTNVELDHHAAYSSEAELAAFFEEWLGACSVGRTRLGARPVDVVLAVPGRAQPAERRRRAHGARAQRCRPRATPSRFSHASPGVGRRFELVGERAGVRVFDDYGHNPTEIAATLRTARELEPDALVAVYQPHVFERTRQLSYELGDALGLADAAIVTDVIGGRDAPRHGVSGKLVLDRVPEPTRRGWAPGLDDAARLALAWARPGDVVITFGVGEPWRIARAIVDGLVQ